MMQAPTSNSYNNILQKSLPLFAKHGFKGVSMRDIAREVGLKAPALYNHFHDKQQLYLKVIAYSFENKTRALSSLLDEIRDPKKKLEKLILSLTSMMVEDENFRHLIQRELLDGDSERLKYLGSEVFSDLLVTSSNIIKELRPNNDEPELTALTAMGMIRQHIDLKPLYPYLSNKLPTQIDAKTISNHVLKILLQGI